MKACSFLIEGTLMLPDGTTHDGREFILPDGTRLGPVVYFERDAPDGTQEDLHEDKVAEIYKTEVNYTRETQVAGDEG